MSRIDFFTFSLFLITLTIDWDHAPSAQIFIWLLSVIILLIWRLIDESKYYRSKM